MLKIAVGCFSKGGYGMSDDITVYEKVSKMFLYRYKEKIVRMFRNEGVNSDETARFQNILRANAYAREIFQNSKRLCNVYENPMWHTAVLDKLDLDLIYKNVEKMPKENEDQYTDNLVKELLRFFKQDFFKWCDKPDCERCKNNANQNFIGAQQPTAEETRFQSGGVEVYKCSVCQNVTRFPRYNDPIKLLETRKGRCGEWCNLFTLILKSFGLDARYIANKEDHVWCEYYSPFLEKWVHVDSCEQSFDEPFIYSVNWNKKMSYCIAYSKDGVSDVSKRYIIKNVLPRNLIKEDDLLFVCNFITDQLRKNLDDNEIYELFCRDERERFEFIPDKVDKEIGSNTNGMKGRQSGSIEWKSQRGEDGK